MHQNFTSHSHHRPFPVTFNRQLMFLLFATAALADEPTIIWPKQYRLKGIWRIPYQRLNIPFEVHTDTLSKPNLQAELSYGGLQRNVHILGNRTYQMQPNTSDQIQCMFSNMNPTEDSFVEYLPDLKSEGWTYDGETVVLGRFCHVWTKNAPYGVDRWFYKFYVDKDTLTPVRYWNHGRSIRHSHPTDYYFDIEEFGTTVDPSVFVVIPSQCRNSDTGGPVLNHKLGKDISRPRAARTKPSEKCPIREDLVPNIPDSALPKTFTWRDFPGVLQMPRDQSNCGSCWAEAGANAISGQFSLLMNGTAGQASIQQIMDCTWGGVNYACSGGETDDAYQKMVDQKMMIYSEKDYPYVGLAGYCQKWEEGMGYTPLGYLKSCWQVPMGDDNALKKVLYVKGPVAVSLLASLDSFVNLEPNQEKPYFDENCPENANSDHSVLLTGWKEFPNGQWGWEIQNSWSDSWGTNGYGYILGSEVDGKKYNCGITNDAFMPEIELYTKA